MLKFDDIHWKKYKDFLPNDFFTVSFYCVRNINSRRRDVTSYIFSARLSNSTSVQ